MGLNLKTFKERMHDCTAKFRGAKSWKERGSTAKDILHAIDGVESRLHELEPEDKYELLAVLSILQQEVDQKAWEVRSVLPALKGAEKLTNPDQWKAKKQLAQASNKLHGLVQQMEREPGSLNHSIAGVFSDLWNHGFDDPPALGNVDFEDHVETFGIVALRHIALTEGATADVQAQFALWGYLRSQLARIDERYLITLAANEKELFSNVIDTLSSMAWGVAEGNLMASEDGGKVPLEHNETARLKMKALDPVRQELERLSVLCETGSIPESLPKSRIQPGEDMPSIPEYDELPFRPSEEEMPSILQKRAEKITNWVIKRREKKPQ